MLFYHLYIKKDNSYELYQNLKNAHKRINIKMRIINIHAGISEKDIVNENIMTTYNKTEIPQTPLIELKNETDASKKIKLLERITELKKSD